METADLRAGFRIGEWLVEPQTARLSGPKGEVVLAPAELELLLALAAEHGEAVGRARLRRAGWPLGGCSDQQLRQTVRHLRELLGGSVRDRRYIVNADRGGFALIAHLELPQSGRIEGVARPRSIAARMQSFVVELRRRNVLKVGGAYLVGTWIVLQVAEVTFEPLRLPEWWMTVLTILAVLGLPIVAALAWSYEITPGGIVLDEGDQPGVKLPRARRAIAPVIVTGVALMALVTGVAWWRSIESPVTQATEPPEPGQRSVAVLPLVDMSPGGGNAYLGDGLAEELAARLAQIPGLRVAARTSAFEFKGRNVDVRRIGEALGVRHVLEGSVRRDGDNLRVTVQLIDAVSGYHVWAGSYDRAWSDVIAIQRDIARSVTEALRIVLASGDGIRPSQAPTPDVRAFDPYLAGLALLRQSGDLSRLRVAGQRFGEAVAIDPTFARAHAGLCEVGLRIHDRTRDPDDLAEAEESCRNALELDPSLVETEKALGTLYLASGRNAKAERVFRGLTARTPQDADGYIGLGRALHALGRQDEAEASFRSAVQAEPAYWGAFNALGGYLLSRGKLAEAVDAFREVTELAPSSASAHSNLGAALQMQGDLKGAAAAFRRSLAIEPSRSAYSNLGTMQYFLHEYEAATTNYERAIAIAGQDQSLWGNLADALWQMPGRREEAVGMYRRAISLGLRELQSNPGDGVLLAQLGYYHGRAGDPDTSREYLARAEATPADAYVVYYMSVAAADRGDIEEARRAAAEAVKLGYPESLLRVDPSLAGLATGRPAG